MLIYSIFSLLLQLIDEHISSVVFAIAMRDIYAFDKLADDSSDARREILFRKQHAITLFYMIFVKRGVRLE